MTFPSVVTTAVTNGSTAATNATVNLPGSIVAGNTLLVFIRKSGNTGLGWPAGWNELFDDVSDGSDDATAAAWRLADGTEGATITVTGSSSTKYAAIAYQIKDAAGAVSKAPEFATLVTGTDNNPDPGTVTPTGGTKDYLFVALAGIEGEPASPPTYPSTHTLNQITANSGTAGVVATNCAVGGACRQATVSSDDPANFSFTTSDDWTATDVAIHPTDDPPFDQRDQAAAIAAWEAVVPPPQEYRRLVQEAAPAAADDPPFDPRIRAIQVGIVTAWHRWRPVGIGGGGAPEAAADDPPFGHRDELVNILRAWQEVDRPPQPPRERQIISVDDPPFDQRDQAAVIAAWEPEPPAPQQSRSRVVTGIPVDDPPPHGTDWLSAVIKAWQPIAPDQQIRVLLPQAVPDNPPFGSRTAVNQVGVVTAWHRWRPVGVGGGGATPEVINDPPFGKYSSADPALRFYQQPEVTIEITLPSFVESVDNPPFGHAPRLEPSYWTILASWQPGPPQPQRWLPKIVAGVPVDDPPRKSNDPLTAILRAWQPGPPDQQIRVFLPQEAAAAETPLSGQRDDLSIILRAWQPEAPQPQQLRPKQIVSVDNPPRRSGDPLTPILRAWQPGPPQPQRWLSKIVIGVAVNDPPFGQRTHLPGILAAWEAAETFLPPELTVKMIPPPGAIARTGGTVTSFGGSDGIAVNYPAGTPAVDHPAGTPAVPR